MTIRVWQAFSCNNSAAYRLVARFADATAASTAGADLATVLAGYAAAQPDDQRSMRDLARQYDFDWEDEGWGRDEDGPHVVVEGEHVFVHHRYCLGLGPGIPRFLADRGARLEPETAVALHVSVLFRLPPSNPRLDDDLAKLFAQPRDTTDWKGPSFHLPWTETGSRGRAVVFRDVGTIGMYFPIDPSELAAMKAWLVGHGVETVSIRFDDADADLFATIAAARCTSCGGPLEYLDPRLHDIEAQQLVCRPCGGFYELAAFTSGSG
jgi:hypothetical protein